MTDPTPRPRRHRRTAEPEKLAPGLYGVGRFGDQHDLTDPQHKWLSHLADADLYAIEGYLRHALARAEHERLHRESDHTNRLTRALDLRDAPTNLPPLPRRDRPLGYSDTWPAEMDGPPSDVLERVRDGLAENLAADPEVKAVMDASVAELNAVRDEYRSAEMRPKTPEEMGESFGSGDSDELPPEVAAKIDEALADPSTFVKRNRPRPRAQEATAVRPAQPWDNDAEGDPWREVPGV